MLKAEPPKLWIWEEQRDLMASEFRFKDAQEPRSLVVGHVHLLQVGLNRERKRVWENLKQFRLLLLTFSYFCKTFY